MFLIAFVTVVISIIGLYAQIISLQTARIYNSQVGLMQTMSVWHSAAVTFARAKANLGVIPTNAFTPITSFCNMTSPALASPCGFGTLSVPPNSTTYLPQGYAIGTFTFYSLAYQIAGVNYVVTFVPDPGGNNYLMLPEVTTGTAVGYTMAGLSRQFARAANPNIMYGVVNASGTLTVLSKGGATFSYAVPPAPTLPTGSLAIISVAN